MKYLKRIKKRTVIIGAIVVLLFALPVIDYNAGKYLGRPIFCVPVVRYTDGGSVKYLGLGYTILQEGGFKVVRMEDGTPVMGNYVGPVLSHWLLPVTIQNVRWQPPK